MSQTKAIDLIGNYDNIIASHSSSIDNKTINKRLIMRTHLEETHVRIAFAATVKTKVSFILQIKTTTIGKTHIGNKNITSTDEKIFDSIENALEEFNK
jgi:hypothetical protein